jgi:hypothetical protein
MDRHLIYVGLGEVDVTYLQAGITAELDARVWDVAPNGGPTLLMTRGTYRIDPAKGDAGGTLRLPLFGNQWNLEVGHQIRLDLSEVDFPYLLNTRSLNTLQISNIKLTLPTREAVELAASGSQTSG